MKIVELLGDLGAFFVSLAVFGVTFWFSRWQVRIGRQKLRHDLYDRRLAIYVAFRELLFALVDKSDGEIRASFRKAQVARFEVPFLLNDSKIQAYLEDLSAEIRDRVITDIMFIQSSEGAETSDPQFQQEVAKRISRLASAKIGLADGHLEKLSQQFGRFLNLTDFW